MNCIEGLVLRLQAEEAHRTFTETVSPSTILVNLTEARRLVRRGETAASFFGPKPTVITTTTVSDDSLNLIGWEAERELVTAFAPTYHIPTDKSVYESQSRHQRRENVEWCMEGTVQMHEWLTDAGNETTILPLVKGQRADEREICYQVFDRLGVEQCAFYGVQYITGGAGLNQLREDIEAVAAETDRPILLIGLLSPLYLSRMPESVVAAAGFHQWNESVEPRQHAAAELRHRHALFAEEVKTALGTHSRSSKRGLGPGTGDD